MTKPSRLLGKKLTPAERQGIITDYAAGLSIKTIHLTHGYAKPTIRKTIIAGGGQLRHDASPAKFSDPQLRAWRRFGWTARRIADHTGAHISRVHKRMATLGLLIDNVHDRLPEADITAAYAAGISMRALATQHDAHISTIRRLIVNNGGTVRTNSRPPRIDPEQLADYCRRGLTVRQISDATGATRDTVRVHLKANGLRVADKRPGHERPAISQLRAAE